LCINDIEIIFLSIGWCDVMGIEVHPAFRRGNNANQGGRGGGGPQAQVENNIFLS